MPTYDYRCKACGHTFELYQTMSEREKRKCPECAKSTLERLIGAGAGLIFKGSGYYLTDYRSKSYEEGAKAERDASKPAEAPAAEDKATNAAKGDAASENKAPAKAEPDSKPKTQPKAEPKARTSAPRRKK
jgi:putative FmdB family regulatory protein